MMFWKADGNHGSAEPDVAVAGTTMANIAPTVTRSLPNIAVHGVPASPKAAGPLNV